MSTITESFTEYKIRNVTAEGVCLAPSSVMLHLPYISPQLLVIATHWVWQHIIKQSILQGILYLNTMFAKFWCYARWISTSFFYFFLILRQQKYKKPWSFPKSADSSSVSAKKKQFPNRRICKLRNFSFVNLHLLKQWFHPQIGLIYSDNVFVKISRPFKFRSNFLV